MAKDMRTWIDQLEESGELVRRSDGVRCEAIGGLLADSTEKALLLENVTGYPGWKVLGRAPANMRQVGIAFETEKALVNREYAKRVDKAGAIQCQIVADGPVKEVVRKGNDVRLTGLPIHVQGQKDKAPFITAGLVINKDPETGKRNMAFHRMQIKGDNKAGIMMQPERHAWLIYQKYEAMNQPMPIAVMIGHHPMYYFAAAYIGPLGLDELEIAGALLEEPVELVKCETVDLEAPAYAEIILEGEVLPGVREDEGPFSEFQNYYAEERKNPVINFKAVTMRRDAVYKTLQHAPPNEGVLYATVPMAAALFQDLRNTAGYVDLKDVYCNWGSMFGVVVKMTPQFYGEAKHVLLAAMSSAYLHQKVAVAVDDDVDIYDPQDVAWAITTRVNPATDVTIIPGVRGHPLDISQPELTDPGLTIMQRFGSRMLIDATKPPTSDPEQRALFDRSRPPSVKPS